MQETNLISLMYWQEHYKDRIEKLRAALENIACVITADQADLGPATARRHIANKALEEDDKLNDV